MAKKKTPKKKSSKKVPKKSESEKPENPDNKKEKEISETPNKKMNENKILKYTLIISGVIILLVVIFAFYLNSLKTSTYKDLEFNTINQGTAENPLIFYQTSFPVIYQGKPTPYNVYLRTNPSKLKRIDFPEENFTAMKYTAINLEENISCDGDDVIAIANMRQIHEAIGAQIILDRNATCDEEGRFTYLDIKSSDKTQIVQRGENCYDLEYADCEILPVTEKYLVELLSDFLSEN